MSTQAKNSPNIVTNGLQLMQFEIDVTNSLDVGTTGITQSRYSIPAQHAFLPLFHSVGNNPLVGTGASVAVGTDDTGSDPDNIIDTVAITGLDAADDCSTPSIGTAIVNNADTAADIYYNITAAALTAGILTVTGILIPIKDTN